MQLPPLSDNDIVYGLSTYNERITRDFFYGYCREAYTWLDSKYQLTGKPGLDFFTLAHTYYISLATHHFGQLTSHEPNVSLKTWIQGGFRFTVLDALKAYNSECEHSSDKDADELANLLRSAPDYEELMPSVLSAVSAHYHNDPTMEAIARKILVEGFRQNEVATQLGITPSAVSQRFHRLMDNVVRPFIIDNYSKGAGAPDACLLPVDVCMESGTPCQKPRSAASEARFQLRPAPTVITHLEPHETFVFGSFAQGQHICASALTALERFGAKMGQSEGMQGQAYAIPTMPSSEEQLADAIDRFIDYAADHRRQTFIVSRIGCEIAGFAPQTIAVMFARTKMLRLANVLLPAEFVEHIDNCEDLSF